MNELFGDITGFPPGSQFADRAALSAARVHGPVQAGIWGTAGRGGAESIVLSGGYEDDQDLGDEIIYTGQGGRDEAGRQIADQELTRGNEALYQSRLTGLPVRVIRGAQHVSPHSPRQGYRYDGLYRVLDAWRERGAAGFMMWRFRLQKITVGEDAAVQAPEGAEAATPSGNPSPERKGSWVVRTVRDTAVSAHVKALYNHACQVCGVVLQTPGGPYAEGAHIRPLGRPHNGPDTPENCLCLCPNHHVLFDQGAFSIDPTSLDLVGMAGRLRVVNTHAVSTDCLAYHREHYFGRAETLPAPIAAVRPPDAPARQAPPRERVANGAPSNARPDQGLGTAALREIVENSGSDGAKLRRVLHELSFRDSRPALRLRQIVEERIAQLGVDGGG